MKIRKKVICVDLDGTICSLTKGNYLSAKPKMKAVKKINSLYLTEPFKISIEKTGVFPNIIYLQRKSPRL